MGQIATISCDDSGCYYDCAGQICVDTCVQYFTDDDFGKKRTSISPSSFNITSTPTHTACCEMANEYCNVVYAGTSHDTIKQCLETWFGGYAEWEDDPSGCLVDPSDAYNMDGHHYFCELFDYNQQCCGVS